ncbi:interferon gamma 1 [Pseudochaenichthys georgianus]|uniref:interferon gamma 1 n=1 Tax=Pseudochaenichthys georgianus TaxID=52239 RepID=UPI00146B0BE4|nr:interferon gamma-like [Pseudochaenichthys georgianus]
MAVSAKSVVCLCFLFSFCHVRGAHIPLKMNRTILNLLKHYNISKEEKYNGQLVFSKESIPEKLLEKRVFMRGVLETYETLINKMLKELPTPLPHASGSVGEGGAGDDVRTELNYILTMILKLKTIHYNEQDNLLSSLKKLIGIKMDSATVQSKALGELPWLYEEASDLNNEIQSRRRRRHAQRVKTHQRG